jgi:transposase
MRPTGSKAELERRRRLGVALHRRGLSIREVARELGCAPGSVARWTKMFNEGGDEGLDPIPNAGGTSRMTDMDRVKLVVLLRLGAPMNGFSTDLWTLRRMRDTRSTTCWRAPAHGTATPCTATCTTRSPCSSRDTTCVAPSSMVRGCLFRRVDGQ